MDKIATKIANFSIIFNHRGANGFDAINGLCLKCQWHSPQIKYLQKKVIHISYQFSCQFHVNALSKSAQQFTINFHLIFELNFDFLIFQCGMKWNSFDRQSGTGISLYVNKERIHIHTYSFNYMLHCGI